MPGLRVLAVSVLGLAVLGACADGGDGGPPTTPVRPPVGGDDAPLADLTEGTFDMATPAFDDGATIPVRYTCAGEGESPPLAWGGVPAGTTSLELVVEDPDAPRGTFLHWHVTGIDPTSEGVRAGEVPAGGTEAENERGETDWAPPCPPADDGPHRYVFRLTARTADGDEVGRAELVGRFGR